MPKHWAEAFASAGSKLLKTTLEDASRVGEITVSQGIYSNSTLAPLLKCSELYRIDYPINDFNTMLQIEPKSFSNYYRFIVPGSIYHRIFPSNLCSIYGFQAFNYPSRVIYAPDHVMATLTLEPESKKAIWNLQHQDLTNALKLRSAELKSGGKLFFDILGMPQENSQYYSWDCLDLAFHIAAKDKLIRKEHLYKLNLSPYFRNKEDILKVLDDMQSVYKLIELQEELVEMPAYTEFKETGDIEKYSEGLVDFWRYPVWMLLVRVMGKIKSLDEIEKDLDYLLALFKDLCKDIKPVTSQKVFYVLIQKT